MLSGSPGTSIDCPRHVSRAGRRMSVEVASFAQAVKDGTGRRWPADPASPAYLAQLRLRIRVWAYRHDIEPHTHFCGPTCHRCQQPAPSLELRAWGIPCVVRRSVSPSPSC